MNQIKYINTMNRIKYVSTMNRIKYVKFEVKVIISELLCQFYIHLSVRHEIKNCIWMELLIKALIHSCDCRWCHLTSGVKTCGNFWVIVLWDLAWLASTWLTQKLWSSCQKRLCIILILNAWEISLIVKKNIVLKAIIIIMMETRREWSRKAWEKE